MDAISIDSSLAVVAGITCISHIYFALYIISPARKDRRIRPLLYLCVFSSLWSACYVMYYLSADAGIREYCQRLIFAGMIFFVFLFMFIIRYTGFSKNKKTETLISIAAWGPVSIIAYKSMADNAVANDFPFGFWYIFAEILFSIYNLLTIGLFIVYYAKNKTRKIKRQAWTLGVSAFVFITSSWFADYFLGFRNYLNIMPFWLVQWIAVLLFTIKRYRFIVATPEFIGNDISENIEESVILLDQSYAIIFANKRFHDLVHIRATEGVTMAEIISEKHVFTEKLSSLSDGTGISFKMQANIIKRDTGEKLPVNVHVKKLIDAYGDVTGYLVIASRVRNLDYLKTHFGITGREIEVIRHIAVGKSNREIAFILAIKETTVETHITSIYNKMGIKNRMELLYYLFESAMNNPSIPAV
ncbi:MAG TPA: LuxR C-terminal-related transcriptional regulator [Spirochaetota bacterium]|nr:LuxR C-terminal-related transcriptional regulator [Spirochaetota bacterium]